MGTYSVVVVVVVVVDYIGVVVVVVVVVDYIGVVVVANADWVEKSTADYHAWSHTPLERCSRGRRIPAASRIGRLQNPVPDSRLALAVAERRILDLYSGNQKIPYAY